MALNPSGSTGFKNALLDATSDVTNMFDGGELHIYSGTQPTNADTTEGAGTVLVTITLPATGAFAAAASGGQIAKALVWSASASASGTATWFRLYDSAVTLGTSLTAVRLDGTVGLVTSYDLISNVTDIVAPDQFIVDTFAIALG